MTTKKSSYSLRVEENAVLRGSGNTHREGHLHARFVERGKACAGVIGFELGEHVRLLVARSVLRVAYVAAHQVLSHHTGKSDGQRIMPGKKEGLEANRDNLLLYEVNGKRKDYSR